MKTTGDVPDPTVSKITLNSVPLPLTPLVGDEKVINAVPESLSIFGARMSGFPP